MKLPAPELLSEKIYKLNEQMKKTDSDMFEYFTTMEVERLDRCASYLYKRKQRKEMAEWDL